MATLKEQLKETNNIVNSISNRVTDLEKNTGVVKGELTSIKNSHNDCQKLQIERKNTIEQKIVEIKKDIKENEDNIQKNNEQNLETLGKFNIVASNVKDLIKYKNNIDSAISKLILTVISGLLIALATKVLDKYLDFKKIEEKFERIQVYERNVGIDNENIKKNSTGMRRK